MADDDDDHGDDSFPLLAIRLWIVFMPAEGVKACVIPTARQIARKVKYFMMMMMMTSPSSFTFQMFRIEIYETTMYF